MDVGAGVDGRVGWVEEVVMVVVGVGEGEGGSSSALSPGRSVAGSLLNTAKVAHISTRLHHNPDNEIKDPLTNIQPKLPLRHDRLQYFFVAGIIVLRGEVVEFLLAEGGYVSDDPFDRLHKHLRFRELIHVEISDSKESSPRT